MKRLLLLTGVSVLILAAFVAYFFKSHPAPAAPYVSGKVIQVSMTDTGFVPSDISISQGDTIRWVNNGTDWHWPASNLHPTHLLYPEFDPLKPVAVGASWDFVFAKVGDWKFHDHLHPDLGGTVHVRAAN